MAWRLFRRLDVWRTYSESDAGYPIKRSKRREEDSKFLRAQGGWHEHQIRQKFGRWQHRTAYHMVAYGPITVMPKDVGDSIYAKLQSEWSRNDS